MGHSDRVFWADFCPTYQPGTYSLATASADGCVKLWNVTENSASGDTTVQELETLNGHKDEALRVAWHPKSQNILASGGAEGSVFIWDTSSNETDTAKREISCTKEQVYALLVSSSPGFSDCILVGYDNTLDTIDLETGQVVETVNYDTLPSNNFQINVSTARSAAAPALGGPRNPSNKPFVFDSDLATVSNCSQLLASALSDGSVRVQDIRVLDNNGRNVACLQGHTKYATSCKFTDESLTGQSYLLSCSGDGSVAVWDARVWKPVSSFQAHSHAVFGVTCFKDTKEDCAALASWSADGSVRCWSMKDLIQRGNPESEFLSQVDCIGIWQGHSPIYCCPMTPDGRVLAVCGGHLDSVQLRKDAHGHSHTSTEGERHHCHGTDSECPANQLQSTCLDPQTNMGKVDIGSTGSGVISQSGTDVAGNHEATTTTKELRETTTRMQLEDTSTSHLHDVTKNQTSLVDTNVFWKPMLIDKLLL